MQISWIIAIITLFIVTNITVYGLMKKRRVEEVKKTFQTSKNRRQAFRIHLTNHKCTYQFPALGLIETGKIRDISATGMRLVTYEDLPDSNLVEMRIFFTLDGIPFQLEGKIVRKRITPNRKYDYGIQFIHSDKKTKEQLFQQLWQMGFKKARI
jgi:c-di-GMP-binding flagellar brake protein YcgR